MFLFRSTLGGTALGREEVAKRGVDGELEHTVVTSRAHPGRLPIVWLNALRKTDYKSSAWFRVGGARSAADLADRQRHVQIIGRQTVAGTG